MTKRSLPLLALTLSLAAPAGAETLTLHRDEGGHAHISDQAPIGPSRVMPTHPDRERRPPPERLRLRPGGMPMRIHSSTRKSRRAIRVPRPTEEGLRPVQDRPGNDQRASASSARMAAIVAP